MTYYKIKEGGFKEIKKQMLSRSIPVMVIIIIVVIVIASFNSSEKTSEVNVLPIIIATTTISAAAMAVGVYRGINRQKALFESYQLTLTNNLVTREQLNTPTISIYFNDIIEIVKAKNGGFTIKGKDPSDLIIVPAQIENYLQLEAALNQIKPVSTRSSDSLLQKYGLVFTILVLASMACVYTVTNKIVVALNGAIVLATMSWSFYEVGRSKNIDSKTKRGMFWGVIVMASVIIVVAMKLIGLPKK